MYLILHNILSVLCIRGNDFFFFKLKICQHLMFKGSIVEGCPNRWLYFFCETRASLVEIEEHKEPLINLVNCYNCILDSITSPWARDTL